MGNPLTIIQEINYFSDEVANNFCYPTGGEDASHQLFIFSNVATAQLYNYIQENGLGGEIPILPFSDEINWDDLEFQYLKENKWFSPDIVANIFGSGGDDCEPVPPDFVPPDPGVPDVWCPGGTGHVFGQHRLLIYNPNLVDLPEL